MKRIFLIVLDSLGIGGAEDALAFGDEGSNTLASVCDAGVNLSFLRKLGLFNIDGVEGQPSAHPLGAFARLREESCGKDTTIGHWELAGLVTTKPFPTFPNGFDKNTIAEIERVTGRKVLCNKPYSGTQVIVDYGKEHIESGGIIVYTSADSVLQIAAHEEGISVDQLYDICTKVRKIMTGENGVARVIARPFIGKFPDFVRTSARHDFSLPPSGETMCDLIAKSGRQVISVGKISDIFADRGITEKHKTTGNQDGLKTTLNLTKALFEGLCFVNLVDFDMLYGHRNDSHGYACALSEADIGLLKIYENLEEEDIMIITADHGCDPRTESTDHSRENVPLLVCGKNIKGGINLGTRNFKDVSAFVLDYFGLDLLEGKSFLSEVKK